MNIQTRWSLGDLYERDFHAWLENQTGALKAGDANALDWPNLAEEIESMGKSQRRELLSRLTTLIAHLLKLEYGLKREPAAKWRTTIRTERQNLEKLLEESPSLRNAMEVEAERVFQDARNAALSGFDEYETENMAHYRETIPVELPYKVSDLMQIDFFAGKEGT